MTKPQEISISSYSYFTVADLLNYLENLLFISLVTSIHHLLHHKIIKLWLTQEVKQVNRCLWLHHQLLVQSIGLLSSINHYHYLLVLWFLKIGHHCLKLFLLTCLQNYEVMLPWTRTIDFLHMHFFHELLVVFWHQSVVESQYPVRTCPRYYLG